MDVVTLTAKEREDKGKGPAGRLRRQGILPGILYGKEVGNIPILIETKELERILTSAGSNALLRLHLAGKQGSHEYNAVIHDVQRQPLKGLVHVDIHQVALGEKLVAEVAVQLTGEAAGVTKGGVLQHRLRTVEVECLPEQIPASLTADVSALEIGDSLKVADLAFPPGVEILTDPDSILATVVPLRHLAEEEGQAEEVPVEDETVST